MRESFSVLLRFGVLCSVFIILSGCAGIRPPRGVTSRTVVMEATGYCECGRCCGWKRVWWAPWRTVYASGPDRGEPKKVGVTASGSDARYGTIAADRRYYPFGTVMEIPGYGVGRVEDTGSAIQGPRRIDLFFGSHRQALEWGCQQIPVQVWAQPR